MKKKLSVIDIFSGAGGFSTGFQRAGHAVQVANDNWRAAATAYRANYPEVNFVQGDIGDPVIQNHLVRAAKGVDVLVGGPPCVAYSLSGTRDPNHPAAKLFEQYIQVVRRTKPKTLVMENVPGILSMKLGGRLVPDIIVGALRRAGYQTVYDILDAADYGAPQHRRRVILIGSRVRAPTLPPPTHGPGRRYPYVTVRDAIGDLANLPEDQRWSHFFVNHTANFRAKIRATPVGTSVARRVKYSEAGLRVWPDKPAPTVKANNGSVFVHYQQDRLMSPRELARLQGIPDNFLWPATSTKGDVLIQIGNAVPVPLAEAIARLRLVGHALLTMGHPVVIRYRHGDELSPPVPEFEHQPDPMPFVDFGQSLAF